MASLGGADSWLRFLDAEQGLAFEWQQYGVLSELLAALSSLLGFVLLGMLFSNLGHAMDQRHSHTRLFHARVGNLQAAAQQHQIPKDWMDCESFPFENACLFECLVACLLLFFALPLSCGCRMTLQSFPCIPFCCFRMFGSAFPTSSSSALAA